MFFKKNGFDLMKTEHETLRFNQMLSKFFTFSCFLPHPGKPHEITIHVGGRRADMENVKKFLLAEFLGFVISAKKVLGSRHV